MSPPDTNIYRQYRRHWPVLVGILLAAGIAAVVIIWSILEGEGELQPDDNPVMEPAASDAQE